MDKQGNALARQMFKEAIALDPEYAIAYSFPGRSHFVDVMLQSTKSPKQSLSRAIELVQKAITLDDFLAEAHGMLGMLFTHVGQHEKGIYALKYAGRPQEAIP